MADYAPINPASASRVRICSVVESVRGTTPANPAWKTLPHLDGSSPDLTQDYQRSNQVKSNRMGGTQVGGTEAVGGPVSVPMKYDVSLMELMESTLGGAFEHPTLGGAELSYVSNGTNASATLLYAAAPAVGDTVVLNGVTFTVRAVPTGPYDLPVAANATDFVAALLATVEAALDDELLVARYSANTGTFTAEYGTAGVVGNAYTVAFNNASANVTLNGGAPAISGAGTMTGGAGTPDRITDTEGRFLTSGFRTGMVVTTSGSTTADNDGDYVISSVANDGSWIELTRDIHTAEAFPSGGSITTTAWWAKAGSVRKFFSLEVSYLDTVPVEYEYFRGMEVNDATFELSGAGEMTGEFNMLGVDYDAVKTPFPLGSGARAPQEDKIPFAGSVDGGMIIRDGHEYFDGESATITMNNNREGKYGLGRKRPGFIEEGDFDAEIQTSIYFTNSDIKAKFRNGQRMAVSVQAVDQRDRDRVLIEFPRSVITAAPKGRSGRTITEQVTFTAEEHPDYQTKTLVFIIPGQ